MVSSVVRAGPAVVNADRASQGAETGAVKLDVKSGEACPAAAACSRRMKRFRANDMQPRSPIPAPSGRNNRGEFCVCLPDRTLPVSARALPKSPLSLRGQRSNPVWETGYVSLRDPSTRQDCHVASLLAMTLKSPALRFGHVATRCELTYNSAHFLGQINRAQLHRRHYTT